MQVTIDKAGRIVVPKPVRDRLGLQPGDELELIEGPDGLLLAPPPRKKAQLVTLDDGWLVIAADGVAPTLDEILAIRDAGRR